MTMMAETFSSVADWFIGFLPNLVRAVIIGLVGWYLAEKVKCVLIRTGERLKWENTISEYLGNAARYILLAVFLVSALKAAGFPVGSLLAAAGISGIIIGMGLRAEIANYFAGVMMLAARPFKLGDLIEFGPPPQVGIVRRVCMTFTAIDTLDHVRVIVPNAVLWRNRIYNFSVYDRRAIRIPLTVPYDVNLDWVRSIVLDVLKRHQAVLDDPAPSFTTSDVTAADVRALVVAWSGVESMNVFGTVITELRKEFEVSGLNVTVPGKDIDLKREE